jgi:hypothetical protein
VAVVVRWSLFRGSYYCKDTYWDWKMVIVVGRWSLSQVRFDCTIEQPLFEWRGIKFGIEDWLLYWLKIGNLQIKQKKLE